MKLTCMLLKHILSILVFGDDIMCPHPSNNAKNIFKMHTAGNFCAKYFPQKLHKYEEGMLANHHKFHKSDASRMMVVTKQPQSKDL